LSRPAVFLDRDGVLNRAFLQSDGKTHPPANPEELELLPGVIEACMMLKKAGFLLVVVTNQPDVARGTQCREVVEAIHDRLRHLVPVDDIRVCYHDNTDNCACRKPKSGLLLAAVQDRGIDLSRSFMVGDRWTDIEAGRRAGCQTVLLGNSTSAGLSGINHPNFQASSMLEATRWILSNTWLTLR